MGAGVAMATAWVTLRTADAAPAWCRVWAAGSALAVPKMNAWDRHERRDGHRQEEQPDGEAGQEAEHH